MSHAILAFRLMPCCDYSMTAAMTAGLVTRLAFAQMQSTQYLSMLKLVDCVVDVKGLVLMGACMQSVVCNSQICCEQVL